VKDIKPVLLGEFDSREAADSSIAQAKLLGQSLGREITMRTRIKVYAEVGPLMSDKSGKFVCRHHPERTFKSQQALSTHWTRTHSKTYGKTKKK
jgi:hypothetical protein